MKFLGVSPLFLTPITPHIAMHPGQGHFSVTQILQDRGTSLGHIKRYDTPLPRERQLGYSEAGYLLEDAIDNEMRFRMEMAFKKRQGTRVQNSDPDFVLQEKTCFEDIHLIPDMVCKKPRKKKIGECKLTFQKKVGSPERLFDEHWAWGQQTQAYAHVFKIYTVEFYVCWIHKWMEPEVFRFEYDKEECRTVWENLKSHRDLMKKRTSTEI